MCCLKMIVEIVFYLNAENHLLLTMYECKVLLCFTLLYKSHRMKLKERKTCGKEKDRNEQTYASKPMVVSTKIGTTLFCFICVFFFTLFVFGLEH